MTGGTPRPAYVPHFRMLLAGLGLDEIEPGRAEVETAFLAFLIEELARLQSVDAAFYAASYPDVAAALGTEPAALAAHYAARGFAEARLPHDMGFDADDYRLRHPDLAVLAAEQGPAGLWRHFITHGWREGRAPSRSAAPDSERWREAAARTPIRLAHRSLDSAHVQAFLPAAPDDPSALRGGPLLGDTPADLRLRHRRGGAAVDSFPPSGRALGALGGAYVYGGPVSADFGMAMADTIHRVLPARAAFACRRLLFVGEADRGGTGGLSDLPPVMRDALGWLGVAEPDVVVIHEDHVVETLHIAQQGSERDAGPSDPYLRMLAAHAEPRLRAMPAPTAAAPPPASRIYVAARARGTPGPILAEPHLEALLHNEGWLILHPQDRPLATTMQMYGQADCILFAAGPACHGVELLGAAALAHCLLLPCANAPNARFAAALRPRARRFDTLPPTLPLADPESPAGRGLGLLDLPALAERLRALGLARLPDADPGAYHRALREDLHARNDPASVLAARALP